MSENFNNEQTGFLSSWSKVKKLSPENEDAFVEAIGKRILVMKDFPLNGVVVLTPAEIDDKLYALSHRWDTPKLTFTLLCVTDLGDGECYYWSASTQEGLRDSILQIPNVKGHLWMDQLCIPQGAGAFKGAQIQFMGQLYTNATSIVSGSNGVGSKMDIGMYFGRAWTQQEFSFGKVMLHPILELSIQEKIDFIVNSFSNCASLQGVVSAAAHHSTGLNWIRSYEELRIQTFDEQIADSNDELKQQVHELWERGWNVYDPQEILEMLQKFRSECKWSGAQIIGPGPKSGNCAFNRMFYVSCQYPKDQLFGMMGAAIYSATGASLDYFDVEGSYIRIMETQNIPPIIGPRIDGDGTGKDGFLTPLIWRENKWDVKATWDVNRDGEHLYHIPSTFPQRSQFGHHFNLTTDIEIWRFERDGKHWLAFGMATDKENKKGKVAICFQIDDIKEHKSIVTTMMMSFLEDRGYFSPDSACNWRFSADFELLLENDLEVEPQYKADGSTWVIS